MSEASGSRWGAAIGGGIVGAAMTAGILLLAGPSLVGERMVRQAMQAHPVTPMVRVPWNDMVTIKRYLDIGAQSLLIPYVNNAEEARAAVSYCRYPSAGVRGSSMKVASGTS